MTTRRRILLYCLTFAMLGSSAVWARSRRGGPRRPARPRAALSKVDRRALEASFRKRYKRGTTAYRKGEYRSALLHYRGAADLIYKPKIDYNMALCYRKLKQHREAVIHLRRFLRSKPRAVWARRARGWLKDSEAKAQVEVKVTSYPAGAAVFFSGKRDSVRGRTPFNMKLKLGRYTLRVHATGHEPEQRKVFIDVEKRNYFDFQLKRQSSLTVAASVPGAIVLIDGDDPSKASLAPVRRVIRPGSHRIRVSKSGYYPVERKVNIRQGEQASVFVDLRPTPRRGVLRVQCNVVGAQVQVEGEDVGLTPLKKKLLVGTYRIFVRHKNHQTWERRVTIVAGQATKVTVRLSPSSSKRQVAWFITGLTITGGLAVSGIVTMLTAANLKAEYDDVPRASLRREGKRLALYSDVLFSTAVICGLITGFLAWRLKPEASQGEVIVTPLVGSGFIGVSTGGRF